MKRKVETRKITGTRKLLVQLVVDGQDCAVGRLANDLVSASTENPSVNLQITERAHFRKSPLRVANRVMRADVVHFLDSRMYVEFGSRLIRRKTIATIHHIAEHESWKYKCTSSKTVVTTDRFTEVKVRGRGADVYRLQTGVNTSVFRPLSTSEREVERGSPASGTIFVGALAKASRVNKNQQLMLSIIERIGTSDPRVHFLLAGTGWEIPSAVKQRASVIELADRISDEEVRRFYGALDVFVSHSIVEGGPLPVVESLACGTPVVSTDVGQVRDWFREVPHAGIVVESSVEAMIDGIYQCIAFDDGSRSARSRGVAEKFDYRVLVDDYLALHRRIANSSNSCFRNLYVALTVPLCFEWLLKWFVRRVKA